MICAGPLLFISSSIWHSSWGTSHPFVALQKMCRDRGCFCRVPVHGCACSCHHAGFPLDSLRPGLLDVRAAPPHPVMAASLRSIAGCPMLPFFLVASAVGVHAAEQQLRGLQAVLCWAGHAAGEARGRCLGEHLLWPGSSTLFCLGGSQKGIPCSLPRWHFQKHAAEGAQDTARTSSNCELQRTSARVSSGQHWSILGAELIPFGVAVC